MCGINGFNWNDIEVISSMNKSIEHRGPDDDGVYSDNLITLGHLRLSILDTSKAGHQPMLYEHDKKKAIIVYNGEIYNFKEIRNVLRPKGYRFKSNSDTEVVLAAYLEYGVDCVNHFNGMWAFCIYDLNKKVLFCSRDRLGVKPFYYFYEGQKFIFSSEIKGLLEHKDLRINTAENINKIGAQFYFSLGFIPAPYSIYNNVHKLEPAQNIIYDLSKCEIVKKWFYYDIPEYDPVHDMKKLIEEGREILKDAVKIRMRSDVPVGAFLSGGVDSSSIVASMRDHTDLKKLHTFSIGFEGELDETRYMSIVKSIFKTNHHNDVFKEKDFEELFGPYSVIYDEPFADYSGFPIYRLAEMAKENVSVCLSGDGGDEIFGGYKTYIAWKKIMSFEKIPCKIFYKLMKLFNPHKMINSNLFKMFEALRMQTINPEERLAEIFKDREYRPTVVKNWMVKKVEKIHQHSYPFLESIVRFDLLYSILPNKFMVKVDRASMAHALEVRSPFLDYRFVNFSRKIPFNLMVNRKEGKVLLKKIVENILPVEIISRGKQGFTPPFINWLKNSEFKIENCHEKLKKIDEGIFSFYKERVCDQNSKYNIEYKVRLFLFNNWYNTWLENKNLD